MTEILKLFHLNHIQTFALVTHFTDFPYESPSISKSSPVTCENLSKKLIFKFTKRWLSFQLSDRKCAPPPKIILNRILC